MEEKNENSRDTAIDFKKCEKSDIHDFYEFAKSPNIGPNAGWEPHNSLEMSLGILRSIIESNNV